MSEHTPPPGTPSTAPRQGSDRFFSWLRGLGIVRGEERWFAGVAGGIAAKAGIDPLIVRGVFVVLAVLGGPGLLLYLAGWLLLPDASGRIHLEELFRGRASGGVIAIAVILGVLVLLPVLVSALTGAFTGTFMWGWSVFGLFPQWMQATLNVIWWLVLVPAGIIWLIVWLAGRSRHGEAADGPGPGSGGGTAPGPEPGAASDSDGARFVAGPDGATQARTFTEQTAAFADRAEEFADRAGRKAEEWGKRTAEWGEKVGKDTEAWAKQYHETHRLGAGHVVLTLAVALIAAGAAAAWALTSGGMPGSSVPGDGSGAFLAGMVAALAVCAVSLIVAGIRGRNSGWIGFLSFCGVVVLFLTAVLPWGSRVQPFGNVSVAVTGLEGSPAGLTVLAGNASVDLTELEEPQDFALWVIAGNATVELPEDLPAVVEVVVVAGNIRETRGGDEGRLSGPFLGRTTGANLDGADPDEISRITVHMVAGNVRIEGANASPGLSERFTSADPRDAGADPATGTAAPAHHRPTLEHAS